MAMNANDAYRPFWERASRIGYWRSLSARTFWERMRLISGVRIPLWIIIFNIFWLSGEEFVDSFSFVSPSCSIFSPVEESLSLAARVWEVSVSAINSSLFNGVAAVLSAVAAATVLLGDDGVEESVFIKWRRLDNKDWGGGGGGDVGVGDDIIDPYVGGSECSAKSKNSFSTALSSSSSSDDEYARSDDIN